MKKIFAVLTDGLVAFITALSARLAQPLKALREGCGHSTLASAAVLGFCVVFSVGVWSSTRLMLDYPHSVALARYRDAQAAQIEAAIDGPAPPSSFDLIGAVATSSGVVVDVFRLPGSRELVVNFESSLPPEEDITGVVRVPFLASTAPENSWVKITVPAAYFGTDAWQAQRRLSLTFAQLMPDGRIARGPVVAYSVTVPSP